MPRQEQILPIFGPMVDTIDKERLQSSDGIVLKRVNMSADIVGNVYANLGIKGTLEIPYPENPTLAVGAQNLPGGNNKTLGWCIDFENEAIVWCVWNSNGDHSIFRHFKITDIVEAIFYKEPDLDFQEGSHIECKVIDGRFYWNDNITPPKSFNIEKAKAYTQTGSLGEKYVAADTPFADKVFPYIKRPPRYAPSLAYASDTVDEDGQTIVFNNLRKKQWQFKYCFVYEDFQESAYSPISILPIPQEDIDALGVWVEEITDNNTILVTVNTGSNNVKAIKIAVRDASNRNSAPFYLFEVLDKFDANNAQLINNDTSYTFRFRNNVLLENIDTERENTYFHNVPLRAKDLILLDNKYVSMSMPVEGYDFSETEVDYDLEEHEEPAAFDSSFIKMGLVESSEEIQDEGIILRYDVLTITLTSFYANSEYRIEYQWYGSTVTALYLTGDSLPGYPSVVQDSLYQQLENGNNFSWIYDNIERPVIIEKAGDNQIIVKLGRSPEGHPGYAKGRVFITRSNPTIYTGLKRGQYHPFAIVYNDEFGRYNVAFGDKKLYSTPFDPKYGPVNFQQVIKPKITIRHRPPEWAHTYRIAYIPYNSYTYMLQIPQVEQIKGDGANGVPSNKVFLRINQAIIRIKDGYPNSLIEAYVWQNGDRVKHTGFEDSYELLEEFSRIYDNGLETIVETGYLCDHEFPTDSADKISGLEVYRPNSTPQDKIYYEIGEEFPILNPGTPDRSHGGDQSQSSDLTTPAVSVLDFGDTYFHKRLSNDIDLPSINAESNSLSDYYQSNGISIGRGVLRTELKQSVLGRVTRSENYIENTELNRLNVFLPGAEFYDVNELDGEITRIIQKSDVLKIIQSHKETSVYVGKNYAKDGNGEDIVLVSDKTFGSFNKYDPYIGSKHPNAVVASEAYVYFLDTFTGDLMRSATNGTLSLPKQYGMQLYFDEKCRQFRSYTGTKDVFIAIEPNQEFVYTTFIMGDSIETIVFSENDSNKGFTHYIDLSNGSVKPEKFAWFGDNLYSWANGRFYIHGLGDVNRFYGSSRKEASIEIVSNMFPDINKTFEYLDMDTDGSWSAEANIRPTNNHPYGQYTQIKEAMFIDRQGKLYSAIPRNIRDQKGNDDVQRLYSGNKMDGAAMETKLSSSDFTALREVKLTMINQV